MDDHAFLRKLAHDQAELMAARARGVAPWVETRMRREMYAEYRKDPRVIAAVAEERAAVFELRRAKDADRLQEAVDEGFIGAADRMRRERDEWEAKERQALETPPTARPLRRFRIWLRNAVARATR